MIEWKKLPNKPGVYIFKNDSNKVIYVGKAKDLRKRVANYFSNKALDSKTLELVSEATSLDHIVVGSEVEAFLLESNLIKKYLPQYNIKYTDDKSYIQLEINKKPTPYVILTRRLGNKNAEYFGPYTSVTDLKTVLRLLRRVFPFQSVKNHPPKRCLYFHIGLCPCVPAYPSNLPQAKKNINRLIDFFEGKKEQVIRDLTIEQRELIKSEEFEKAALIQKQIERINILTSETYEPFKYEEKPDYYFDRIKNEIASLKEILTKYGLEVGELHRIECYDISNIQGKNATGSLVVFTDGDSNKNQYRRFRIRFKKTPDDFAMHQEVAARRIKQDWPTPDLIVIDGGKGQVSSVLQIFGQKGYSVPVIGLAKREETIVVPVKMGLPFGRGAGLDFLEVKLPTSTPGINLLRRLRDEAHRFAITYHRLLRKKALNI